MTENNDSCVCCSIHAPGPFAGWDDFEKTEKALKTSAEYVPVPVARPYSNVGLVESWYECRRCTAVWRLVEPDPPYAGLWERVV